MKKLVNITSKTQYYTEYLTNLRRKLGSNRGTIIGSSKEEVAYYRRFKCFRVLNIEPVKQTLDNTDIKPILVEDPLDDGIVLEKNTEDIDNDILELVIERPLDDIDNTSDKTDSDIIENDPNLSPGSRYTYDFLTKKKAVIILGRRKVPFDEYEIADVLKNLVLSTNP